jgi:hypothetical protein
MNICADILQNIENDPDFLGNVITYDESWFFQYDLESKHQSIALEEFQVTKKKKSTEVSSVSKQ